MPQFFQVNLLGELASQKVANVFWYMRAMDESPTAADVQELVDDVQTLVWNALQPNLTSAFRLKQVVGYGYAPNWVRTPFLPYIKDVDLPGAGTGASAPPILAAILSCRVEPIVPGPQARPNNTYALRPVRRGYWAICGLPQANFQADGKMVPTFNTISTIVTLRNAVKTSIPLGQGGQPAIPVRVSALAKGRADRGYGLIVDASFRPEISTRRSRKVGIGA